MTVGRGQPPAVARVLQQVVATSRKHDLFQAGDRVLVACSGGPDSTCLLHTLHRLRRLLRIELAVFHFDHRLRPDSPRDARHVERQASSLRLPFVLREAVDAPRRGQSVEAWARLARYGALTTAATELGADRAALGHTEDDQAETVLLGLIRGGGLEAVAGMPPVASLPPLGFPGARPLLETSRAEVTAFNRSLRLRSRQDPTNRDPRFLRNRIRMEVLPVLERSLDRGIRATLARAAEHVRDDVAYLDALASEAAKRVTDVLDDEIRMEAAPLERLPRPIAARVV
ncbi:MAG TPA: tRNA lysidine(34) synthetase TilS, partial [Actinomycetota bacterium]|nr:tRNA lysidine(34) synthetase TilS [Actinomycetota bacterium]